MNRNTKIISVLATALTVSSCGSMSDTMSGAKGAVMGKGNRMMAEDKMPFSGPQSVAYAGKLWSALDSAGMLNAKTNASAAYKGSHPHGAVLRNIDGMLTVDGATGPVLVKSNYGGEGVSIESVTADPAKYLMAITVMYKRSGYDPENNDWFWAKYLPDGSLDKNPKGMQLAGRVAKVEPPGGCIACHKAAPGGDMVFSHDRFK